MERPTFQGVDMTQNEIDEIVEIDRINMEPILKEIGIIFDCDKRKTSLLSEISLGSEFVLIKNRHEIKAYIQYLFNDELCDVRSIQIKPEYKGGLLLKQIFIELFEKINNRENFVIKSSVHKNNIKSMALHRNLKFNEVQSSENRVEYQISSAQLAERIKKFTK